jgi:hypothetical protein
MDTSGFYKFEGTEGFYAPNFVYAKDFELLRENHTTYTYPVHGWWWFESLEQAQAYFDTRYNFGLSDTTTDTASTDLDELLIAYLEGDL